MDSCPRPPWAFSMILSRLRTFHELFSGSARVYLPALGQELCPERPSSGRLGRSRAEESASPPSSRHFVGCYSHVGTGSRGLSRRMRSRMARRSHRGTGTCAIWKITYRACPHPRMGAPGTFAILIRVAERRNSTGFVPRLARLTTSGNTSRNSGRCSLRGPASVSR